MSGTKMITNESIVLTHWIKKVGVDEFGFLDHKENPQHVIDYVDVHCAPQLDKVLPLCTQVFVESATAEKVYTYFRPTSMAVEFLLNCKNELAREKEELEKNEHSITETKKSGKSGGLYRMFKTAKVSLNKGLASIYVLMGVALKS